MAQTGNLGNGIIITTGAGPERMGTRMKFVSFHAAVIVEMTKPARGTAEPYRQAREWLEAHGFEYRRG
jgi:hypothetical protein